MSIKNLAWIVLVALLLASCDKYSHNFELDEKSFGAYTIRDIEKDSGFVLPADVHGLNYFYKAPIDPGFAAKLEISSTSKEEVFQRISKMQSDPVKISGALGPRFPWWIPAQAKTLVERESFTDNIHLHAVLTDEGGRTFLYLEWSVF